MTLDRKGAASLVEYVYGHLRDGIVRSTYRQGEPLRPPAIAAELEVSVIPVREAVRLLEADGLVEITPNRGARVAGMSPADLTDIYDTRKVLEAEALRRSSPRLTAEDLTTAQEHLDRMVLAYRRDDIGEGMRWHRAFHDRLYARAGSPRILGLIETLWSASDRYLWLSPTLLNRPDFRDEHEAILRAVRDGDAEAARHALDVHHDLALQRIRATIPEA